MLRRGHLIVAAVALTTVLAEILVILLGAIPFSSGQIYLEYLVSMYWSVGILSLMLVMFFALMLWKRRAPLFPRRPDTIASVISYLSDSRMLDDFEGFEYLSSSELEQRVSGLGRRYVYERQMRSDGHNRYLVDSESNSALY